MYEDDDYTIAEVPDHLQGAQIPEDWEVAEFDDGNLYAHDPEANVWYEIHGIADERATDDTPPAWAQPLLEQHATDQADAIRADERARVEAELEEEESPFVEWLRARPHLVADFENFERFVDTTPDGDLERAEQLWQASQDKLEEARRDLNIDQPKSYEEATDQWFAERRAAVEPLKQDAPRRGDPMAAAMNEFAEELHAKNEVDRAARELVREQELRGRG